MDKPHNLHFHAPFDYRPFLKSVALKIPCGIWESAKLLVMAECSIRKLVFIQIILVLLRFNRDIQIQCTMVTVSPAGAATLINPGKVNLVQEQQPDSPAMLQEAQALNINNPELKPEATQVNNMDLRKKRDNDDALLDIEEKDLYLAEKMEALGQTLMKLKNYVPEMKPGNNPQGVNDLLTVMKIDPAKEKAHLHGISTMEIEGQSNNEGNDDDEESEVETAAEISSEKYTKSEPSIEPTKDNSQSEETAHQLYGTKTNVKPLENFNFEEMGQPETAPESDSLVETPQFEDEEGEMDQDQREEDGESTLPLMYGAGTLLRPVQNDDTEQRDWNGDDDGVQYRMEDHSHLKKHVLTSVLDVELITDGYDCNGARGPLAHVAHESKFFVDRARLYNIKEAREVCSKYNLVIAEIEGVADHRTIEQFVSNGNYYIRSGSGGRFFIGLNDIRTEGIYQYANGKNATFQNFLASQPDDKNGSEDCVTIMKEQQDGAAGAADYDCNKTAHVFCMHRVDTQCYNESKETIENRKHATQHDLQILVNASERAYFVSNYQLPWKEAMKQCNVKQLKLFDMDAIVNMGFFRAILRWEKHFFRAPMPTVQYWTSGKFKKSHMTAPIIWHTKTDINESEERGIEKHNSTFTFSGLFKWSTKKKRDPGGPHGWRRDLCVSFGFDSNPEAIPFTRNTNCDLPTYFICYVEYPETGEGSGEETTTEEVATTTDSTIKTTTTHKTTTTATTASPVSTTTPESIIIITPPTTPTPGCPKNLRLLPPKPENKAETAEIEAMLDEEGWKSNMSCSIDGKKEHISSRNGIAGENFRWRNGFTVYIDDSYDDNARKIIGNAMDRLRKVFCLPFYLFQGNQRPCGDYVHIVDKGACYAHIGRRGGRQEMSLGRGCLYIGTIMHEMIHAIGFWHEHARPDRDQYVNIFLENVMPNQRHNFDIVKNALTFGVPYNTISIMHYRSWEFSANGKDTILDKNGGKVGSLDLQQTDIEKLQKMYNCPVTTTTTTTTTTVPTTTARPTTIPFPRCPKNLKLLPPEPENVADTVEFEAMLDEEGWRSNMSCKTNDKEHDVLSRNGIVGEELRWRKGFTVYIDNTYDDNARKIISNAMDRLRKVFCIPFYLFRPGQRPCGDYVHIVDKGECYSLIGKRGGAQEMSLGRGCLYIGTIMHEMIHAIGFWHEHARPDRDQHVNIFLENIIPNQRHNFDIVKTALTFDVPYNTISIMHYRSWEFSANGKDTILDKKGGKVGSLELQQTDIDKLKKMYNCGKPQPRHPQNKRDNRRHHGHKL